MKNRPLRNCKYIGKKRLGKKETTDQNNITNNKATYERKIKKRG